MNHLEELNHKLQVVLLTYLKDTKKELEEEGFIATLDLAIEKLEEKINK